jgi:hypothetical protein
VGESISLAGVEADERESRQRRGPERSVVEPLRHVDRRARMSLGRGKTRSEPKVQAEPVVDRGGERRLRSRVEQRLVQQQDHASGFL